MEATPVGDRVRVVIEREDLGLMVALDQGAEAMEVAPAAMLEEAMAEVDREEAMEVAGLMEETREVEGTVVVAPEECINKMS